MHTTLIASLLNRIRSPWAPPELSNWVEQRGSADVAENVRGALSTLDENLDFIRLGITELTISN